MSQDEFFEVLGSVFEHTPDIARKTWHNQPFNTIEQLHQRMVEVVKSLSKDEQLTLIRVHPDLGSKAKMAAASVTEQIGVGLDQLTAEECDRLQLLNKAYKEKFSFPFIVAVRNHTKASLFEVFEQRLNNPFELEREQALNEIFQISRLRLSDITEN